jgi:hypothetical protein
VLNTCFKQNDVEGTERTQKHYHVQCLSWFLSFCPATIETTLHFQHRVYFFWFEHICLSPLVSLVTIPLTFYNAQQFLLICATCAKMGISVPVVSVKQTHLQASCSATPNLLHLPISVICACPSPKVPDLPMCICCKSLDLRKVSWVPFSVSFVTNFHTVGTK